MKKYYIEDTETLEKLYSKLVNFDVYYCVGGEIIQIESESELIKIFSEKTSIFYTNEFEVGQLVKISPNANMFYNEELEDKEKFNNEDIYKIQEIQFDMYLLFNTKTGKECPILFEAWELEEVLKNENIS